MSVVIKLNDLSITNSTLPQLDVSDDDIRLASLPELTFWLQAGAEYQNGTKTKERAMGRTIDLANTVAGTMWEQGTFTNGAKALVIDDAGTYPYLLDNPYQVNKNAWTAVFVFERSASDVGNSMLMGGTTNPTSDAMQLYIGMTTKGLKLYDGASRPRIEDGVTTGKYVGVTLGIISFSTTNGLTMRVNGAEVARKASDKAPLTDAAFRLLAASGTTNGKDPGALGGKLGTVMMFDADLCLPAYNSSLSKLESVLMTKYGIV